MKLYDNFCVLYKLPFGAVKVNDIITIRISTQITDVVLNPCLLICEIDNWYEFTSYPMNLEKQDSGLNWYSIKFSISKPSIYYYFFKLTINGNNFELKRAQNYESILDSKGDFYQLTVYDKSNINDDNYNGGIMYQIFPDRFYGSGVEKNNIPMDRRIRDDWGGLPEYLPDYQGKITNSDYFCGDIKGITLKLDYLFELGVTSIYINPIFEAHSNHRYDTADYLKIDPLLGTETDFNQLCSEAKKRGMVIILDGVFSHTGSDSIYFNKNNRYDSVGAYNNESSKYHNWYKFINYPNNYKSWWGFDTLPELDKENEDFIEFVCGENGVIDKWIKAGAYGFRLDVVDELNQNILEKIKEAVIKFGGKILIGEVWEDATTKRSYGQIRQYLLGKQLDSTMNYPFKNAILSYIRYGCSCYFYETIMSIVENYPKEALDSMMNMLSTHDTERAITKLVAPEADDCNRYWQADRNNLTQQQYDFGKKMLKLATVIQYFVPGLPCIYYGDEAGLYGYRDPFNRCCYPWKNEDYELIEFFKEIGKVRKMNNIFKDGYFRIIYIDNEICIFERFNENESIVIAVNRTDNSKMLDVKTNLILQYKEIAKFGQYDNFLLGGYSSVVLKRE
jgi:cyclomaltodextrinase / maltogenic alpha-amylase / neopullulanase